MTRKRDHIELGNYRVLNRRPARTTQKWDAHDGIPWPGSFSQTSGSMWEFMDVLRVPKDPLGSIRYYVNAEESTGSQLDCSSRPLVLVRASENEDSYR
ncbi:hypothetical protein CDL15_Pgr013948 [Punica granatum]|uniref:Uncharacterized protein n=1 Tax=Punica granatum TaxID=22663 RepID=A0A218W9F0_PUNGR|nr:hypothetical protein CDL15_Pgr013948 [Punica granatum]